MRTYSLTEDQYNALCAIVDRVKRDERPADTDAYVSEILQALDLKVVWNA